MGCDIGSMFGFGEPQLADNQSSEHITYTEKLGNSCTGMVFGFILFFGSLAGAGWNEYRYVATQESIDEARGLFISVACSPILPENDGKLVHITCPIDNLQILGGADDALMGVPEESRRGLSLESYMEVYSWKELTSTKSTDDKVGGGTTTVTTYTYSRDWSSGGWSSTVPANNNTFYKSGDTCTTQNGGRACYNWKPENEPWWKDEDSLGRKTIDESTGVEAGDFVLPKGVLKGTPEVLTPSCSANSAVNSSTSINQQNDNLIACAPGNATLKGNKMVWQQKDSNGEMVDYLTKSYSIYTADTVSALAQQKDGSFVTWNSEYDADYGFFRFNAIAITGDQMLDDEEASNTAMVWGIRFLTLVLCVVGLVMITAPLTEIPDIIPLAGPFVGDLIGWALWVVDCLCGCCCWSTVVAICWISYRPYVAIPLLCGSVGLCALGGFAAYSQKGKKAKLQAEAAAAGEADEKDVEEAEIEVEKE